MQQDLYRAYQKLKFDRPYDGVLRIQINSGLKLNVMDPQLHKELASVWPLVDQDDTARSILLTGSPIAFSAGGDLNSQLEIIADHQLRLDQMNEARAMVLGIVQCSKPVVAAIRGWAVGAGLACALVSDISVAAKNAKLVDGHTKIGIPAGDHAALIWPLLCGMAKAKYHLLLGEPISGEDAASIGLISLAVNEEEVEARALKIAKTLADSSSNAIGWTKLALNSWLRQATPIFDLSLALEMLAMGGRDAKEGLSAFLEKRSPQFGFSAVDAQAK